MDRRPIMIFAPKWNNSSGGIMALHRLCHLIRKAGVLDCFLWNYSNAKITNPEYNTSYATHKDQTKDCVAIYPEIICKEREGGENPLNATKIVRWLLNKPGVIKKPVVCMIKQT